MILGNHDSDKCYYYYHQNLKEVLILGTMTARYL